MFPDSVFITPGRFTYQGMVYFTDMNLPINVKTIDPLFRVIPAQTKPKLV